MPCPGSGGLLRSVSLIVTVPWDPVMKVPLASRTRSRGIPGEVPANIGSPNIKTRAPDVLVLWSTVEGEHEDSAHWLKQGSGRALTLHLHCWKKGKKREINGRKKKMFKGGKKQNWCLPPLPRQKVCRRWCLSASNLGGPSPQTN